MHDNYRISLEERLPGYVPNVIKDEVIEGMSEKVHEAERKTLRVSNKVHEIWRKSYKGLLSVHQYIYSVTMSGERVAQLVEDYHSRTIDELEFTIAIAGKRRQRNR